MESKTLFYFLFLLFLDVFFQRTRSIAGYSTDRPNPPDFYRDCPNFFPNLRILFSSVFVYFIVLCTYIFLQSNADIFFISSRFTISYSH